MSKKSDLIEKLLSKIEPRWPAAGLLPGANLLEQGLFAVLQRRLDPKAAERAVENLRKAYADWNELRVAQAQEIAGVLKSGASGVAVAGDVRAYLQEVFQRSHGLSLDFLRDDPEAVKRFVATLPFIGMGLAHHLMWICAGGEVPVTAALTRVLDRIGVVPRAGNARKTRAAIVGLIDAERALEFALKIGEVATRWCDAKKPLCHQCAVVDDCRYGRKAFREWRLQQERLEAQRIREEARLAVVRRKEEARQRREEARSRRKAAIQAEKRAREEERRARIEAKKKAAEEQRLAAQRAREEAQRRRAEERARKQAAAEAERKARKEAAAKAARERSARRPGGKAAAKSRPRPAGRAKGGPAKGNLRKATR